MYVNIKLSLLSFLISFSSGFTPTYEFINKNLIPELEYLNTSADPCENFYQFTCGNFKNVHPLPEGKYNWDHFTILQDEIHQVARAILKSKRKATDPVALQKAKAAYVSCLDVEYAEHLTLPQSTVMQKLGIWPVISVEEDPNVEFSWNLAADLVAEYGVPLFFNYRILSNYWDSRDNFIYIYRDALSNPATVYGKLEPDRDDYLSGHQRKKRTTDSASEPIPFEAFLRSVAFYLRDYEGTWKTDDDIIKDLDEVVAFMRILQPGGLIEDDAKILPLDSLVTVGKLQEWTEEQFGKDYPLDWVEYLNHLFKASGATITKDTKIYHDGARLLYGVLNLFRQAEPRLLKSFVMTRLFTHMAPDSNEFLREAFDTYYRDQGYVVYDRPDYCLRKILGYPNYVEYSMAITYEYQRYHFNVNKLQKASEMMVDIQGAFKDILRETDWMDASTKANALKKADEMITLLGYPEYVEDQYSVDEYYDGLRVCTWEHFWNMQRARSYSQATNFKLISQPRNRELWDISPLEVNGFYSWATNRILLPASMLNPVFFGGSISALDYGRVGAIMGHEITHGYDGNGKLYNEEGLMVNWWSEETAALYSERVDCFLEQYGQYYIDEIDTYVDPTRTLNENLADNGGLRAAYRAFRNLKERTPTVKIVEDFTDEQLFFIGFGTMWCIEETEYYLQQMYKTNVYPPNRYRVNGAVSNMEEFAKVFKCPVGSPMNPAKKCALW